MHRRRKTRTAARRRPLKKELQRRANPMERPRRATSCLYSSGGHTAMQNSCPKPHALPRSLSPPLPPAKLPIRVLQGDIPVDKLQRHQLSNSAGTNQRAAA